MKARSIPHVLALLLFLETAWGAEDVIRAEVMERRIYLWDSQTVQAQDHDLRLAAYKDWVYLQKGKEGIYKKLVPGICPQWIPTHKGQPDHWFYVFLPVGFDGKSELWTASTDGYYLGKAAEGMFFVNSTPVLSPDGERIASVVRPLARVQGDRSSVTVIKMRLGDGQVSSEDWIYEGKNIDIRDLRFENNDRVSFSVIQDGRSQLKTVSLSSLQQIAPPEPPPAAPARNATKSMNPASMNSFNSFRGHGLDDISSHIFGIEGKVVRIRKTASVLKSITVKLIKPLPTALGWIPYEKPGKIIVIHFDESLSQLGSLRLTTGSIVRLDFGEIDNNSKQPHDWGSDWGSNFSWLTVERNGAFYNTKSEKVE